MLKSFKKNIFRNVLNAVWNVCVEGVREEKLELVGTLWQKVVNIVIGNLWKGLTLFTLFTEE